MTFADRAIPYYTSLTEPTHLPSGIRVMNPYRQSDVKQIVNAFYTQFFSDNTPRVFVLGINPGRFGAGVTGISFTTPQNLRRYCGIDNPLRDTPELSSRFIYQVIEAFGGARAFYSRFFLTSLFPLALVKTGLDGNPKNYNFYDDRATTEALWPIITHEVKTQLAFGYDRRAAICLGRKNEAYLRRLNDGQRFFDRIITLDHPRYILQYKARDLPFYVEQYMAALQSCIE